MADHATPDIVPLLGRGHHRTMRKGACFMEMASYLAGEKWSDHPRCTHPLLGELARDVNDAVSDDTRQRLAPMIPDVVGLNPTDPRVDAWIARLATIAALPISAYATQRVVAVGLLRCERMLAEIESRPSYDLSPLASDAFSDAPEAATWAHDFVRQIGVPSGRRTGRTFASETGPVIVRHCVSGIAQATVRDREERLLQLLHQAIDLCRVAQAQPESRRYDVEPFARRSG
ncbi:hypothetical protein AB3X52_04725 [Nocardioides sp. DS6]|uniref:DUF222 domain-containing protein n=1 Tax=Nocardioides eburneus TaxID=3231482 RepID=A0ABV3SX17_9ACTN